MKADLPQPPDPTKTKHIEFPYLVFDNDCLDCDLPISDSYSHKFGFCV